MGLLPIEQERLLVELAPHSCEIGYVAFRLGKLDSGDVWDEAGAIQSLKRAGLIEYEGERFEMSSVVEVAGQQVEQTLKLWDTFALTGDGVCYLRHYKRERRLARARVVLEIAGALSAIVTLVITIASLSTAP